jgi:DNA-binding HxlR family transcriptional regulator
MARPAADRPQRSGCPIAISLDIFGDRWSLLIVRDLIFCRGRSFREFEAAGEGIATNILAERLDRLERAGIIRRRRDPDDRRRVVYLLTDKGIDLAPVLVEMIIWAARHERTEAPEDVVTAIEADRMRFIDGLTSRCKAD